MARKFKFRFIGTLKTFVNHIQLNIKSGPLHRIVGTVAVNITIYVSFLECLFEARYNLITVARKKSLPSHCEILVAPRKAVVFDAGHGMQAFIWFSGW